MQFAKLDDSPMFRQQIHCLEEGADVLREKCMKLYKGCRKYTEGLGEGSDGDISFVSALEAFEGGHDDSVSVAFGEPVMNKLAIALRQIGTYKEVLRLQVEHMLNVRLQKLVAVDFYDVKEARKRFDKATLVYDQAREKFLSLRKSARLDIAVPLEEELRSARFKFEHARFSLVGSLSNIEARKRFEFLEAAGGAMAAHLHYFKQGYELLQQMEPFINQVLVYAQQSRESSDCEQKILNEQMQEYQRQIDEDNRKFANGCDGSPRAESMQTFARSSHKNIEAVMQSASKGKVQTIRQGYLSKRSSNLRGDWKRRFFILDSRGMLYYYRKQWSRSSKNVTSEHGSGGFLNRWRSSHYHGGVNDEKSVACHTVNLLTSTIKIDADQSDLRFCFRIVSPSKVYALQAESAADQMDWVEKITGVIASLLSSQTPERYLCASRLGSGDPDSSIESPLSEGDFDQDRSSIEEPKPRSPTSKNHLRLSRSHQQLHCIVKREKPIDVLRRVSGNDKCADCGSPEPDWASLNLCVLICIECSGVHRNLGVHISKVRSLTLDVKVWEPSVLIFFQSLGNVYTNSIWEELLNSKNTLNYDDVPLSFSKFDKHKLCLTRKPNAEDHISVKEKFINAKYTEKLFVRKIKENQHNCLVAQRVWESVRINDIKGVYRYIINSEVGVNSIHGKASFGGSLDKASSIQFNSADKREGQSVDEPFSGCSLLHLACQTADVGMVELLLQYGANINSSDSRGQTPLHHCIMKGRTTVMKVLLSRGADPQAVDSEGKTALQLATESNFTDTELLAFLRYANR